MPETLDGSPSRPHVVRDKVTGASTLVRSVLERVRPFTPSVVTYGLTQVATVSQPLINRMDPFVDRIDDGLNGAVTILRTTKDKLVTQGTQLQQTIGSTLKSSFTVSETLASAGAEDDAAEGQQASAAARVPRRQPTVFERILMDRHWFTMVNSILVPMEAALSESVFYNAAMEEFMQMMALSQNALQNSKTAIVAFIAGLKKRLGTNWHDQLQVPAEQFWIAAKKRYSNASESVRHSADELLNGMRAQLGSEWKQQVVSTYEEKIGSPARALYEAAVTYYVQAAEHKSLPPQQFIQGVRNSLGAAWNDKLEEPLRAFLKVAQTTNYRDVLESADAFGSRTKNRAAKLRAAVARFTTVMRFLTLRQVLTSGRNAATNAGDYLAGTWQRTLVASSNLVDRVLPEVPLEDVEADFSAPRAASSSTAATASGDAEALAAMPSSIPRRRALRTRATVAGQRAGTDASAAATPLTIRSLVQDDIAQRLRIRAERGIRRVQRGLRSGLSAARTLSTTRLQPVLRVDVVAVTEQLLHNAQDTIERARTQAHQQYETARTKAQQQYETARTKAQKQYETARASAHQQYESYVQPAYQQASTKLQDAIHRAQSNVQILQTALANRAELVSNRTGITAARAAVRDRYSRLYTWQRQQRQVLVERSLPIRHEIRTRAHDVAQSSSDLATTSAQYALDRPIVDFPIDLFRFIGQLPHVVIPEKDEEYVAALNRINRVMASVRNMFFWRQKSASCNGGACVVTASAACTKSACTDKSADACKANGQESVVDRKQELEGSNTSVETTTTTSAPVAQRAQKNKKQKGGAGRAETQQQQEQPGHLNASGKEGRM